MKSSLPSVQMANDSVAVIVVNWNGIDYLQSCLASMACQTFASYGVIVVDNGSTDGSVQWVRQTFPQVRVIANSRNLGFAEANNVAIAESQSEYVVLLNNDACPEPDWLTGLVSAAETDIRVGMVASQVTFADRPGTLDSAGIEVDVLGVAWNRHLGKPVDRGATELVHIFGPSGSAALYRRSMLDEIGAFDARYFAYYEDVDLAWRAQRAGWGCLYAPSARVSHVHSATGGRLPGFKAFHLGRNKWRTLFKHYPFARLAPWVPLLLLTDTYAWTFQLIAHGNMAALRGRREAWRERRMLWEERQTFGDVGRVAGLLSLPSAHALLGRPGARVCR